MWNISILQRKNAVDGQKRRVSQRTLEKIRLKVENARVKTENFGVGKVSNGLANSQEPKVQIKKLKKAILKKNTTVSINVKKITVMVTCVLTVLNLLI